MNDAAGAADAHGRPRVVITGMGALTALGNGVPAMLDAMHSGRGGLRSMPGFAALGLHVKVGGPVALDGLDEPPRKLRRFMPPNAVYAWHAANEAIVQAALAPALLHDPRCGLIVGGGAALSEHEQALDLHRARGIGKLSPFLVPRGMSSAPSAGLALAYGIGGISYTVSSACTSAAHAIGQAMEQIQLGKLDLVLAGGTEELHDSTAMWFDVMGALSATDARTDGLGPRPYASGRDGFALAAGAGMLVMESLAHARDRGATVLAELTGYGSSTDAASMVGPGADGIVRAIDGALASGPLPDYINTHACGTPQGDAIEWQAIARWFTAHNAAVPPMSSLKGQTAHAPGAAAALDAIACVLMLRHQFIAAGALTDDVDPVFADAPLLATNRPALLRRALSMNFGFGGGATALLFDQYSEDGA
jgi:3-oxoacyl-[acyl-carrier-protein] synthase-1